MKNLTEIKERYAAITDSMIYTMGQSDHAMHRLMANMQNEYKTGASQLNRCPRKARKHYLNRTQEQKKKYYNYVRKIK